MNRRTLIKAGALSVVSFALGGIPSFVAKAALQEKQRIQFGRNKTLICIFQRGAMDGLMAVQPIGDDHLKKLRPDLFLNYVKGNTGSLFNLDERFGLHPAMSAFNQLFQDGQLAIVHGIGSPNKTRSHFDAQDFMESGTPYLKSTPDGWMNRVAQKLKNEKTSPFQLLSLTNSLPRSLYGKQTALTFSDVNQLKIKAAGKVFNPNLTASSFEALYDETQAQIVQQAGQNGFEVLEAIEKLDLKGYKPDNNARYPNSALGKSLQQIAQLIKADLGVEMAFTESNNWDTHRGQGKSTGIFANNVRDLSDSIAAFWQDLEKYQDDVLVLTMTEFGRTVHQNGSKGTDHGRGSCSFLLGNNVNGGMVHGSVGSLHRDDLEDGRDLPVTTDYRSVFHEVAVNHFAIRDTDKTIFPDFEPTKTGVMK